jgi:hypothetical protein
VRRAIGLIALGVALGSGYYAWPTVKALFAESCEDRRKREVSDFRHWCMGAAPHLSISECQQAAEASEPTCK